MADARTKDKTDQAAANGALPEQGDADLHDLAIIGAGPIGLACGVAARRAGLSEIIFDKGGLVNSFIGYPTDLEFFSTPELLEIADIPFTTRNYKPVRAEAIEYYRHVAMSQALRTQLYEAVEAVDGTEGSFEIRTSRGIYSARRVVVATGFFDIPNPLGVPGEDLPKVSHYYREPFPYTNQRVAVVGARNSAAKVALDLTRHGAEVTLVIRGEEISPKVKYWIKPDLENRIKEGRIDVRFKTIVKEIREDEIVLSGPAGEERLPNDWVLAMTGYRPDFSFLRRLGIEIGSDEWQTPVHDTGTMETNRPGLYLAGVICGGMRTSVWFVENSRVHADAIVADILKKSDRSDVHEVDALEAR